MLANITTKQDSRDSSPIGAQATPRTSKNFIRNSVEFKGTPRDLIPWLTKLLQES